MHGEHIRAEQVDEARAMESTTAALLPYLPAGLAVAVAVGDQLTGHGNAVALLAATLVMAALLARQLLAVLDNSRLVLALVDTQQALRFQAFHDPLTGLARQEAHRLAVRIARQGGAQPRGAPDAKQQLVRPVAST